MTCPWMDREDEAPLARLERGDDRAQPLRLGVRLPVNRQRRVDAFSRRGTRERDGFEKPCRVGHHVADDLASAGDAFRLELAGRALVRAEEKRGEAVDLDPVPLLRHREVEAPEPRLDVREPDSRRRVCAGERRVRVAVHEHPVGPLALDRLADRGVIASTSDVRRSRR